MQVAKAVFDTLRSIGFGAVSAAYAAVGTAVQQNPRIICLTNNTDADMILATDNTNVSGNIILLKGTFKLYDLMSNINSELDTSLVIPIGTILYVKGITNPTRGSVYLEYIYGV